MVINVTFHQTLNLMPIYQLYDHNHIILHVHLLFQVLHNMLYQILMLILHHLNYLIQNLIFYKNNFIHLMLFLIYFLVLYLYVLYLFYVNILILMLLILILLYNILLIMVSFSYNHIMFHYYNILIQHILNHLNQIYQLF